MRGSRADLTFKANLARTRHGWLRLTPAHAAKLVGDLLDAHCPAGGVVLDPFCGSGTTALACAERGVACDTTDINPFLVWLAAAKGRPYGGGDIAAALAAAPGVAAAALAEGRAPAWLPPIHRPERWWSPPAFAALGRAREAVEASAPAGSPAGDLLRVAFCRCAIGCSGASFGHQSMSFKSGAPDVPAAEVAAAWSRHAAEVAGAAAAPVHPTARHLLCDARDLRAALPADRYDCVVTSPPYPNRMSYVRELRPYMYWLGYLADGRSAGELDWKAIGGTWGCATSNLARWRPEPGAAVPSAAYGGVAAEVARRSPLLGAYLDRYFHDVNDPAMNRGACA